MSTSDKTKTQIERLYDLTKLSMWEVNNIDRLQYPGSHDARDGTIVVDDSLDPFDKQIVEIHELVHAFLGKKHYGEMIRRMETFGSIVTIGLNIIRHLIITEAYTKKYGAIRSAEDQLNVLKMMPTLNEIINSNLAKDEIFVEGIRFIQEVEDRNILLLREWRECQEAGAYWIGLRMIEETVNNILKDPSITSKEKGYLHAAKSKISGLRDMLRQFHDHNGEGFRRAEFIAQKWGEGWVYGVLHVCLRPDITKFSILRDPINDIKKRLDTTLLSPDKRFSALYDLVKSGKVKPRKARFDDLRLGDIDQEFLEYLFKYLDPENPKPLITVEDFNDFWNTLDADKEFVALMNRILKRIGSKEAYAPIQLTHEDVKSHSQPAFLIKNYEGRTIDFVNPSNEENQDTVEFQATSSLSKNSLLRTAKLIGIIK